MHRTTRPRRIRTSVVAALTALAMILTGLVAGAVPASAAPGDYTIEMTGTPTPTVPIRDSLSYSVTVRSEVSAGAPADGIVLTSVLSAGQAFDPASVDTGPSSPVASVSYVSATRTVTFTMKPLTEPLVSFSYAVTQNANDAKSDQTVLSATLTGNASVTGAVPAPVVVETPVTGDYNYSPAKSANVIPGSDNRTVTWRFDVTTNDSSGTTETFATGGQRLRDTFPAGTRLIAANGAGGTWDLSIAPGTTATEPWTATWQRTGAYSPNPNGVVQGAAWIQVYYPEETFPQVPGATVGATNTVTADVLRVGGDPANPADWRVNDVESRRTVTVRSPAFGPSGGPSFGLEKVNLGSSAIATAGLLLAQNRVAAGYASGDAPLSEWIVEDDSQTAGNVDYWGHMQVFGLLVTAGASLQSSGTTYQIQYRTTTLEAPHTISDWQTVPQTFSTTTETGGANFFTVGSAGYASSVYPNVALPVGQLISGWRVVMGTAAAPVPVGSDFTVRTSYAPLFTNYLTGAEDAGGSGSGTQPRTNVAQAWATQVDGDPIDLVEASVQTRFVDSAYVTTNIAAPSTFVVNTPTTITAAIVNQNPQETYHGAVMEVVLPHGMQWTGETPVPHYPAVTVTGTPVPAVGDGVTLTTKTITGTDGLEHQVLVFTFDELPRMRPVGLANDRWSEGNGFKYRIPVIPLAQAYDPADTAVDSVSWAYTDDPDHSTVPARGYGPFFGADVNDFDPNRTTIARAVGQSQVTTSGGLLIAKQASATGESGSWVLDAEVTPEGGAHWNVFISNVLPRPVTDAVFFDALPRVGDADGSEFTTTLTGPVSGLPDGWTVEYSTDATSIDDAAATWTSDPVGASAFRVSVPTLASGTQVNLTFPSDVPPDARGVERAVNDIEARATYDGTATSFVSNDAAVTVAPEASFAVVKTTNGTVYEAAPGAVVATGSTVTWAYEVTNTGNVAIDDLALVDAFTDGTGTTGEVAGITSADSGPLAPGATRIFEATGAAVVGQYENTVTVTGTPVDGEGEPVEGITLEPVTDDSWYLAGTSGLEIRKTTNGGDYEAAPGAILAPGDDVTWQYLVSNTGTLDLVDVLVEDYDDAGELVFSDTIPLLRGGEEVLLEASGTAVSGQYHNTVTASAADPLGPDPLVVSDESWYLAGLAGLTVVKTTNGVDVERAPGVEVEPGSEVTWAYTVTNTGELDLAEVLVEDVDDAGEIVFSEYVDSLPVGASVTLEATGTAIEGQYHNRVSASAQDPSQGESEPMVAYDDSWYFGATPGLALVKEVAASADGPWLEKVEVTSGGAAWWRLTVTNTGNVDLTDVVVHDDQLGEIAVADHLAVGESASVVVTETGLTSGYVNVATATGATPGGSDVTSPEDTAEVVVLPAPTTPPPTPGTSSTTPPPTPTTPPAKPGPSLPVTGAQVGTVAGAAALLLAAGALLLVRRRRTARD